MRIPRCLRRGLSASRAAVANAAAGFAAFSPRPGRPGRVPAAGDIDPEALLGREEVDFASVDIRGFLRGKTVLVTGAGGTIGSELCRRVAACGAGRLLLFDIDENALFFPEMDLRRQFPGCECVLLLGSIRDRPRLDEAIGGHRPEILFHAAAHKHVAIIESAPGEAVKNNVVGTYEVAACASRHGVGRFVLVSSDKAAARSNVLGASKWLAESLVGSMNGRGETRFQSVRFGNVLDSSGSLLEIVRQQIHHGGPVTITHPDMERYFMTLREAVGLILAATVLGEGDTNVLDMGRPVRVEDLVRRLLGLSGLTPGKDVLLHYARPRPGERLGELPHAPDEELRESSFPRIKIVSGGRRIEVGEMIAEAKRVASAAEAEEFLARWLHGRP